MKAVYKILLWSFILVLFSITFQPVSAATTCCIDTNTKDCRDTTSSCDASEQANPATLCAVINSCNSVCCCAKASAPNPDSWNFDEGNLIMNNAQCTGLGSDYQSKTPSSTGQSCSSICSNLPDDSVTPTQHFSVSGRIINTSGNPLEGANINIPSPSSTLHDTSLATGTFTISQVPEHTGTLIVTKQGCTPQSKTITVSGADLAIGDITLDCNINACTPTTAPTITPAIIAGTPNIQLTFTADSASCDAPTSYRIIRDDMTQGQTIEILTLANTHLDENVLPETEYCYKIQANYPSVGFFPTEQNTLSSVCITTGVSECMFAPQTEWCFNSPDEPSAVHRCTNTNLLESTVCTDGNICTTFSNGAGCAPNPGCDDCNGLFGTLKHYLVSIFFNNVQTPCNALANICFIDQTQKINDAYRSCGEINSCENYQGEDACAADPCGIQTDCAWNTIFPELGLGVCQSTQDEQKAACNTCENIFGLCNKDLCEAIGENPGAQESDCYYDSFANGLDYSSVTSSCVHKEDMGCRFYDTKIDCQGNPAQTPTINVQYFSTNSGERIGGDNTFTTTSNDLFAIGSCKWREDSTSTIGGNCYKDADDYSGGIITIARDDREQSGVNLGTGRSPCYVDSEPPHTTLLIADELLPIHKISTIPYIVSDNHYTNTATDLQTRFCIFLPGETPCYPTFTRAELTQTLPSLALNEQKTFSFRFYSFDPSGNIEPVQQKTINVIELGYPILVDATLT